MFNFTLSRVQLNRVIGGSAFFFSNSRLYNLNRHSMCTGRLSKSVFCWQFWAKCFVCAVWFRESTRASSCLSVHQSVDGGREREYLETTLTLSLLYLWRPVTTHKYQKHTVVNLWQRWQVDSIENQHKLL